MSLLQKRIVWITFLIISFLVGCFTRWQLGLALPFLGITASLSVLIAAAPGFFQFLQSTPKSYGIFYLLGLCLFALGVEILGVQTGFPYGSFAYHPTLHSQLILGVPWTTPLGWLPLVFASFVAADKITKSRNHLFTLLIAVLILVGIDLVLDPGAVALGLWRYVQDGIYYGVPLSNFLGWILSGTIALFLTQRPLLLPASKPLEPFYTLVGPASLLSFWLGIVLVSKQLMPALIGVSLLGLFSFIWQAQSTRTDRTQPTY